MRFSARVLRLVGRVARARRLPEAGAPVPRGVRWLAGRLDGVMDAAGLPTDLGRELSELEGYFSGLCLAEDRDPGSAGISWARSALIRITRDPSRARPPFPRDRPLAKVYELLGRQYLRFGDFTMAADCYGHASLYWHSPRNIRRTHPLMILCHLMAGDRAGAAGYLADFDGEGSGPPRHFLRVARKLVDPASDLRAEVESFRSIKPMGLTTYAYLASVTAGRLAGDGHLAEALRLVENVARDVSGWADDWIEADLRQRRASVLVAMGRYEESRDTALAAWATLDSARYQACSHTQRESAWRYFAPSRYAALRSAIALGDGESLCELIESCRLQSLIAAEVEVEELESEQEKLDNVGTAGADSEPAPDDSPKNEMHAGASIFAALNDAFNSTLLLAPKAASYGATKFPDGAFWSTHIENGMLFWFLAVDGKQVAHGVSDLRDHENLQPVLRALAGYSDSSDPTLWSLPPYKPQAGDYYEPVQHLAEWKSPEEQIISTTIGRLLPEPLVALLLDASRNDPLHLTIAAARELAAVLWPIAIVPGTEDRLIERAVPRLWTSSAIETERAARPKPPSGAASPFLLACDNPDQTLRERVDSSVVSQAKVWLSGAAATKDALADALRDIGPGTPGLFFYTGHALHDADPAYSTLPLAGAEVVRAGELFGAFPDGTPFLPMPSRVILACCSSSGNAMLGGETIGLAAGVIQSGAHQVIATGVDVFDSSFTQAFDDILVEGMLRPDVDACTLLRAAQLRMLHEWKVYSLRGGTNFTEDFKDPHPVIWAAYQAY